MLTVQASSNHLHLDACGKSSCVKGDIALIGFVILTLGKPFYRIKTPGESPILRIEQVIVVAFKTISYYCHGLMKNFMRSIQKKRLHTLTR
ncbi:hypothetical protein SESBI_14835 [Sesbania bispinosa]|nr:hypothetical protein SESBI_14835 [Sesbania bispinosa]